MPESVSSDPSDNNARVANGPLIFPFYYGPALQSFGTALLWFGRLNCVISPWVSPVPVMSFRSIAKRAAERDSILAPLFVAASNIYLDSCRVVVEQAADLEVLESRICRIVAVGSGGQASYRNLRTDVPFRTDTTAKMLVYSEYARIAHIQFIWRCYEYYLEFSKNSDAVIDALELEGGTKSVVTSLLSECLLNHFRQYGGLAQAIVTDDRESIALLADFGKDLLDCEEKEPKIPKSIHRQTLSCSIFENVLSGICLPLNRKSARYYLESLDTKNESIEAAKRKCFLAADKLTERRADPDAYHTILKDAIADMRKEVREIVELDREAWAKYVGALSEDRVLWGSCLAIAGGATGALPPITFAAAAVSVFTSVATKGIAEMRAKKRIIKDSEWSFVYGVRRKS